MPSKLSLVVTSYSNSQTRNSHMVKWTVEKVGAGGVRNHELLAAEQTV